MKDTSAAANFQEATLLNNFDDLQKLGKDSLDASVQSFTELAKSAQSIASEMTELSKKTFEGGTKALENMLGAKTPEQAVQVQADFFKTSFENYVAGLTKISELYADLAKQSYKSFEPYVAKAAGMK